MAAITRNVIDIQGDEKRSLEHLLGKPLQDDQKVFIMLYTDVVPNEATRVEALEDLRRLASKAEQHAAEHGYTNEQIDAAIEEAMEHVRPRDLS